ncbi:hypothetical protein FHG87_006997 [Trinorchestia longiramus]|nr:hypothetical protein FHG87_006997 [Trinorchestia longiramus]
MLKTPPQFHWPPPAGKKSSPSDSYKPAPLPTGITWADEQSEEFLNDEQFEEFLNDEQFEKFLNDEQFEEFLNDEQFEELLTAGDLNRRQTAFVRPRGGRERLVDASSYSDERQSDAGCLYFPVAVDGGRLLPASAIPSCGAGQEGKAWRSLIVDINNSNSNNSSINSINSNSSPQQQQSTACSRNRSSSSSNRTSCRGRYCGVCGGGGGGGGSGGDGGGGGGGGP